MVQDNTLFLKKQLVIAVCEPDIPIVQVTCQNQEFSMFQFGMFEFDNGEYVFGTEENQYNSTFHSKKEDRFPVIIVKKTKGKNVLTPWGSFSPHDQEVICDTIRYSLEVRQTAAHYQLSHCS